jgi:S1-C subfamily serine protease
MSEQGDDIWTGPEVVIPTKTAHSKAALAMVTATGLMLAVVLVFLGITITHQYNKSQEAKGVVLSTQERTVLEAAGAKVIPSVVDINAAFSIQQEGGAGTGIIVSKNGLVVTNNHVVAGASRLRVVVDGGKTYNAYVVGYDHSQDIAVIKLEGAHGLKVAHFGSAVALGQAVVGVGNAGGIGGTPFTALGSVTGTNSQVLATDPLTGTSESLNGLISTNVGIVPGDSGGPLIASNATVVGLNTAAAGAGSGPQGFSIPIARVERVLADIKAGKSVGRVHVGPTAFIGILTQSKNQPKNGVLVGSTVAGSPASKILVHGDLITSMDGVATHSVESLTNLIVKDKPGQRLRLTWTHAGKSYAATITLAKGPAQ